MATQPIPDQGSDKKDTLVRNALSTASILVLLVATVVLLWLGWAKWVIGHFEEVVDEANRDNTSSKIAQILDIAGPYGDLFGGINALFTGLGLAFLIYTILQQSRMIHQQQISINQQTEDLQNQKIAAERNQALQSMLQIRAVLQDEETRKAREIVLSGFGASRDPQRLARVLLYELEIGSIFSSLDNLKGKTAEVSSQDDVVIEQDKSLYLTRLGLATLRWHRAAERVLDSYNYLGILWSCDHFGEEDKNVLMETWGPSINRCHDLLVDYCTMKFRPNGIDRDTAEEYLLGTKEIPEEKLRAISYVKFNFLAKEYLKNYQSKGEQDGSK